MKAALTYKLQPWKPRGRKRTSQRRGWRRVAVDDHRPLDSEISPLTCPSVKKPARVVCSKGRNGCGSEKERRNRGAKMMNGDKISLTVFSHVRTRSHHLQGHTNSSPCAQTLQEKAREKDDSLRIGCFFQCWLRGDLRFLHARNAERAKQPGGPILHPNYQPDTSLMSIAGTEK